MRKIVSSITVMMLLSASACFGQIRTNVDLLGVWTSKQVRVEFMDNSKVSLVFPGNKRQVGTYKSDFLLNPGTLEMSFNDGDKKLEFKCLIQFTDNNTLKWESFSKSANPHYFTSSASILNRTKN